MKVGVRSMRGVITGAGRGIGAALLRKMASEGHDVFAISRSETEELSNIKSQFSDRVSVQIADISDYALMSEVLETAEGFGDFLVCNAGQRFRKDFLSISQEEFSTLMNVNFLAQVNLIQNAIRNTIKHASSCSIVGITSIVGPQGFSQLSNYAATKGALEALIKSLAVEFAPHNIRLNCVAPGFVASSYAAQFQNDRPDLHQWTLGRTPLGRWGECSEIADLCAFLVSAQSSFITGETIFIDGGWSAA